MGEQISVTDLLEQLGEIGSYLVNISSNPTPFMLSQVGEEIVGTREINNSEITIDRMRACAKIAAREYQLRAKRRRYFSEDLFGEPAWDILLDLFISRVDGIRLSVKSVCIGSQVPPTTALRWITVLESQGLLEKIPDLEDGRRIWIEISDSGFFKMYSLLNDLDFRISSQTFDFARMREDERGEGGPSDAR